MKIPTIAIVLLAIAASPARAVDFPRPYPGNNVSYEVGGLMSWPKKIVIDLDDGTAWVATSGSTETSGAKLSEPVKFKMHPDVLKPLKALASVVAHDGMETKACEAARKQDPDHFDMMPMDSHLFFSTSINGESASAPVNSGCWTQHAVDLAKAVQSAVGWAG